MNLQEYLQANPTATLASTQAYAETGQRMISPDMMVAFMTSFQHVSSIMNATTEEAKGLQLALQFGSEFNLINNHPASVKPLLDKMVTDGLVSQAFVDYAIAYANPTSTPFANITQADYDNAKLFGDLESASYSFMGGIDYQVVLNNKQYKLIITFDNPVPVDCTVTVTARNAPMDADKTVDSNFALENRPLHVFSVKAGDVSLSTTISKPLARHIKLKAVCSYQFPFNTFFEETL